MPLPNETDVLIIGAGPAGIAAAIQLKRYGIPFLIFEKEWIGGLLWNANLVENYPGFANGVSGPKLIGLFEKQMERIGVEITREKVIDADWANEQFSVEVQSAIYHAKFLVIASGTKAMPFPISAPMDVQSHVFSDVVHLLDVSDRHIVIVGAGDAAFDHALNLVKKRNSVTILNRGRDVKCLPLLAERIKLRPEIQYRDEVAVSGLESSAGGLIVHCRTSNAVEQIKSDYVIFAIGRESQQDFLSANLREKESELIFAGKLHFVGDVRNGLMRQTAIATGDGLRAAMQIYLAKG